MEYSSASQSLPEIKNPRKWHDTTLGIFKNLITEAFQNEVKIVLIIIGTLNLSSDLLNGQKRMNKIAQNWASLQKIKCNKIVSYI